MKKVKLYLDFLSASDNVFIKVAVLFTVKKIEIPSLVINIPAYFPRR